MPLKVKIKHKETIEEKIARLEKELTTIRNKVDSLEKLQKLEVMNNE